MMWGSKTLIPIEDTSLNENYAINKFLYPEHTGETILVATIYKEHYPLLYKAVEEARETFIESADMETIRLFRDGEYNVSDDGKTLSYGKFKVTLE